MKNTLQGGACLFVEMSTGLIAETATGHFVETVTEKIADGLGRWVCFAG